MADQPAISANVLAQGHKAVSIAEFFEKNKHFLGYENPQKSLLTVVREAVDNALDACEESRILPDIYIEVQKTDEKGEKFKVIIEDNGPGIVKKNLPNVFGKLLYGSKFHRLRQSRGQQGIGISGAVLYSQLTSGKPTKIYSRIGDGKVHIFELKIDTLKNEPEILSDTEVFGSGHGVRIEMEVRGKYMRGKQSIPEYVQQTAIMNPFCSLTLVEPDGTKTKYERGVNELPAEPKEIQPHPHGIDFGIMLKMMKMTNARNLNGFLTTEFSRVGSTSANEICMKAGIDPKLSPKSLTRDEAEKLYDAMQNTPLQSPPTDCLSPVGEEAIKAGIKKELKPEFIVAVTRTPSVYQGIPFQIEVGIGYGGTLEVEGNAQILRFANRVPLLYEQSGCALTKAVIETDWKRYGIQQTGDSIPRGPVVFSINMVAVKVPFTSEGKEAVKAYPEISKEVKLALQEAGRQLGLYLGKKRRAHEQSSKKVMFQRYSLEVVEALHGLTGVPIEEIEPKFAVVLEERLGDLEGELEELQDEDYLKSLKDGTSDDDDEPADDDDDGGEE